jgi:hypothetical protein
MKKEREEIERKRGDDEVIEKKRKTMKRRRGMMRKNKNKGRRKRKRKETQNINFDFFSISFSFASSFSLSPQDLLPCFLSAICSTLPSFSASPPFSPLFQNHISLYRLSWSEFYGTFLDEIKSKKNIIICRKSHSPHCNLSKREK